MQKAEAKILIEERRLAEQMRLLEFKAGMEVRLMLLADYLNEVCQAEDWKFNAKEVAEKVARIVGVERWTDAENTSSET